MPHRVSQWNFTDRGSATGHNDFFRGKGNGVYKSSTMRANEGFASVRATFPAGSFATCRYPNEPALQRTEAENSWHPRFVGVCDDVAQREAGQDPEKAAPLTYNTTGTKPLPIPFSQRPGYEEEERRVAAEKRAKYLAFKSLQLSSTGDVIPADFHDHTIYSQTHVQSALKAGEIFRPSKERVGTTPAEREAARLQLEQEQRAAAEYGARLAAEARRSRSDHDDQRWAQQQWDSQARANEEEAGAPAGATRPASQRESALFPAAAASSSSMHMGYNLPPSSQFALQQRG